MGCGESGRSAYRSRMSEAHLPVRFRSEDDVVIVAVGGELDLATVPAFLEATQTAIDSSPSAKALVLDLLDLAFMDSSGLGAILTLEERHPPLHLLLVVGDGIVEKVLVTTAMHKRFQIFSSVAEALDAGPAAQARFTPPTP